MCSSFGFSKKAQLPLNVRFPSFSSLECCQTEKLITWTELCEKQIATLKPDGEQRFPTCVSHWTVDAEPGRFDQLKKEGNGSHTSLLRTLLQRLLQLGGVRTQMQKLLSHKH